MTHHLTIISGQEYRMPVRLTDADGHAVPIADYDLYGAARRGSETTRMSVAVVDGSSCIVIIPPLEQASYTYDLYLRHRSTAAEVQLLAGNIAVRGRVASMPPVTGGGEDVAAVVSADMTEVQVTVTPIAVATPDAWDRLDRAGDLLAEAVETASSLVPDAQRIIRQEVEAGQSSIKAAAADAVRQAGADIAEAGDREVASAADRIRAVSDEEAAVIAAAGAAVRQDVDTAGSSATSSALAAIDAAVSAGEGTIGGAVHAGADTLGQAAASGKSGIQAAVTAGTGTIAAAVTSGKASIDSYVSANQADIPRKSQPNIWAGVNTLNGPVILNDSATLTKATYAPSALINCDTMLALTYVAQAIQCGYYSAFDSTSDSLNALAFSGVTATPAATSYAVRPMYGQGHGDLNNRYVTIRAEFGDNMCVHFGGGRNTPSGVVRMQAPCVLHTDLPPGSDSPYYDHEAQYFAVVGKGYCANAQPVLILYHRASDEILYAEALMPAARSCTISTHYLGGVAGKYYDQIYDIYSGRTGYVDTSPRTRITLVGRGKYQMTGGGAVVSSVPNNAGRACVRTWPMVAPSEAQVAVIRAHTLAAAYSSVRTKPVTCDLPDACAVAAEGGVISGTATSVNAWPADYLAAYVVRLADWVSIRTVSDATQSSPAVTRIIGSGTITLTVSPNTTGAPRSACVLVGAPSCPARIITITQSAS